MAILVIIQEISYSNWRTGEMVQNLESLSIILENWQLCLPYTFFDFCIVEK